MAYRIAQILAFYREAEAIIIPDKIVCTDIDFNNSLEIIKILKSHTIELYYKLSEKNDEPSSEQNTEAKKEENVIKARELHSQGLSYRQISQVLLGSPTKHQTIWRWINQQSK